MSPTNDLSPRPASDPASSPASAVRRRKHGSPVLAWLKLASLHSISLIVCIGGVAGSLLLVGSPAWPGEMWPGITGMIREAMLPVIVGVSLAGALSAALHRRGSFLGGAHVARTGMSAASRWAAVWSLFVVLFTAASFTYLATYDSPGSRGDFTGLDAFALVSYTVAGMVWAWIGSSLSLLMGRTPAIITLLVTFGVTVYFAGYSNEVTSSALPIMWGTTEPGAGSVVPFSALAVRMLWWVAVAAALAIAAHLFSRYAGHGRGWRAGTRFAGVAVVLTAAIASGFVGAGPRTAVDENADVSCLRFSAGEFCGLAAQQEVNQPAVDAAMNLLELVGRPGSPYVMVDRAVVNDPAARKSMSNVEPTAVVYVDGPIHSAQYTQQRTLEEVALAVLGVQHCPDPPLNPVTDEGQRAVQRDMDLRDAAMALANLLSDSPVNDGDSRYNDWTAEDFRTAIDDNRDELEQCRGSL